MRFIVITRPDFIPHEAAYIDMLFHEGLDILHLRKPYSERRDFERLVREIPEQWHGRIVLGDHFELLGDYALKGVHLGGRNPRVPAGARLLSVSASCHSLEEVVERRPSCSYVYLSPIFNSISKEGYTSAFSAQQLEQAAIEGIVDGKVIALGGIQEAVIGQLREWRFGGAAFLGDVWRHVGTPLFLDHVRRLRRLM